MSDAASAMLEEIDDCIARIAAFQKASGRRVFKLIKRSRKGRGGMATLAGFGLPIPADFAALYDHFDGIAASARLSFWETTVFLDAFWPDSAMLAAANEIARLEKFPDAGRKIRPSRRPYRQQPNPQLSYPGRNGEWPVLNCRGAVA